MGLIRFLVPDRQILTDDVLQRIYVSGLDEIPWPTSARWVQSTLVIEPAVSASGNVHFPRWVAGHGELVLPTCTLIQREKPYVLDVELARGAISQIRDHLAVWEPVGLVVPQALTDRLAEAIRSLSQAVGLQHEPAVAAERARGALDVATDVAALLSKTYAQQAIAIRRRETPKLATLLGVNLGSRPLDATAARVIEGLFHLAVVPIPWHDPETDVRQPDWSIPDAQLAWCQRQGVRVCAGPLLQLDARGVPDWLGSWQGDFEDLLALMLDHIKTAVTRYRGRVHVWQVAARINVASPLSLTEQQRLEILVRAIETVRDVDAQTSLVVMVDQPWAEYMSGDRLGLAPLPLADALLRADLGVAGLGLEINAGYHPGGTMPRAPLAYSRQLDRWSQLGAPLLLALTAPSGSSNDTGRSDPPRTAAARPRGGEAADGPSATKQRDWVARYFPLMLAKQCVQVILWNQLRDSDPQGLPHGGLLDADGRAKPVIEALRSIRTTHLA